MQTLGVRLRYLGGPAQCFQASRRPDSPRAHCNPRPPTVPVVQEALAGGLQQTQQPPPFKTSWGERKRQAAPREGALARRGSDRWSMSMHVVHRTLPDAQNGPITLRTCG